jgi:hypothetical protein
LGAPYRRPAIAVAAIHTLVWLIAVGLTPPLPDAYFGDRGASFTPTPNGMQFDLRSSDPSLILAERPFGEHHLADEPVLWVAFVLNIPAVLSAVLAETLLAKSVGLRAATWFGTGLFFVVSIAQWLCVGWAAAAVADRIRSREPRVRSQL